MNSPVALLDIWQLIFTELQQGLCDCSRVERTGAIVSLWSFFSYSSLSHDQIAIRYRSVGLQGAQLLNWVAIAAEKVTFASEIICVLKKYNISNRV